MQKPHQATEPRAGMLCEQATLRVLYYLAAAHNLHRRLRRRKAAKKAACRIAALYNLSPRKDVHPMRAIIDASSDAETGKPEAAGCGRCSTRGANAILGKTSEAFCVPAGVGPAAQGFLRECSVARHKGLSPLAVSVAGHACR